MGMDIGLGRIAGSRELSELAMLGRCTSFLANDAPYAAMLSAGDKDREASPWLGLRLVAGITGERSDETEDVRLRRPLPWHSWW